MRVLDLSSGDVVLDRRLGFAEAMAKAGDPAAAAELMAETLAEAPEWAAGWMLLGDWRQAAGDVDGAAAAWDRLAELDAEGIFGARLKLASIGREVAAPAPAYVEALFDDYAPRFDAALVHRLGYETPQALAALIGTERPGARFGTVFDLGCGTGLMGAELRADAERLVGVDLSEAMLALARKKQIYDQLARGELLAWLASGSELADLVTASDVLNYTGALPPILRAVKARLAPGGLFAFSLETHAGEDALRLGQSLRFSHQPELAAAAAEAEGYAVKARSSVVLRKDRGEPVLGELFVLRNPA
jgi:predicted TPR repeat methyltransferase